MLKGQARAPPEGILRYLPMVDLATLLDDIAGSCHENVTPRVNQKVSAGRGAALQRRCRRGPGGCLGESWQS